MPDALAQIRALLETPSHRLLDDGRPHITAGVPRMDNCRLCEALALLDGAVLLAREEADRGTAAIQETANGWGIVGATYPSADLNDLLALLSEQRSGE